MPTAVVRPDETWGVKAAPVLAVVATGLMLIGPRASPGVLAALAGMTALAVAPSTPPRGIWRQWPAPGFSLLAAFAIWALLSAVWAADRTEAAGKGLIVLSFVAVVWAGQRMLAVVRRDLLRHIGLVTLMAFGAALAFVAQEEATGHLIKRLLFTALPFLRPADKHLSISEAEEVAVAGYISNRNMAAIMLALWPMLLIATAVTEAPRRRLVMAVLAALAVVTLLLSKHETSIIALAASSLIFAVGLLWPRLALALVAAGWLAAVLLVVPVAKWASAEAGLHSASWLPNSARHRIVLWHYTAEQVSERPLTGVGAASTKLIDARRGPKVAPMPGTPYQWRSGPHAHNVYLQTWYEVGAVGALLLGAAGLFVVGAMTGLKRRAVPFAAAAFTTAAVMGASSWGLWQAWFLGLYACTALLTLIALRILETGADEVSPARAP